MAQFHDSALIGASGQGGYQIERSLRFNSADSAYLELTTGGTAGNQTTWTFSCWVKRSKLGTVQHIFNPSVGGDSTNESLFRFETSDKIRIYDSGTTRGDFVTTQVFRDTSAWYHIVVALDTTQGTSTNRFKLYVNGVQITTFDTASYPGPSVTWGWNRASTRHRIGAYAFPSTASNFGDFYLTEIHFIDGQALTPSSFGETNPVTGVWQPKRYSGTYGTNGFYLKFADNSGTTSTTLGKDSSGNGNNWTPNNFSVTAGSGNDSLIDTPTPYADGGNGRGNYATLNPLNSYSAGLSNGNLQLTQTASSWVQGNSTIGVSTGKWFWEVLFSSGTNILNGITKSPLSSSYVGSTSDSWGWSSGGLIYTNGNSSSYGSSLSVGDIIGVALDLDAGTLTFYKNGVSQGQAVSGLSGTFFPAISIYGSTSEYINFGQRAFSYTPPSGFLALNTQNLPEPSIKKPSSYMDVLTWSGTGGGSGATRSLTGLGFSPDLVWQKARSSGTNHRLLDAVRGAGTGKTLSSNTTSAEGDGGSSESLYGYLSSFDSNGFTLTNGTSTFDNGNKSGDTYVAWCWDESATPGFDIVTWVGTAANLTLNHSLGVAPKMMIVKSRTQSVTNWCVYHEVIGNTKADAFNRVDGPFINVNYWNNTSPTASNFTVGTGADSNGSGHNMVAYLFSEVAGFSKFGSYTGNSSTDGPFVFCGFRPALILMRRIDGGSESWSMWDNKRAGYNAAQYYLAANSTAIEDTTAPGVNSNGGPDFLSNGFKMRSYAGSSNNSGTYVFAAWAETPFKYSLAR